MNRSPRMKEAGWLFEIAETRSLGPIYNDALIEKFSQRTAKVELRLGRLASTPRCSQLEHSPVCSSPSLQSVTNAAKVACLRRKCSSTGP